MLAELVTASVTAKTDEQVLWTHARTLALQWKRTSTSAKQHAKQVDIDECDTFVFILFTTRCDLCLRLTANWFRHPCGHRPVLHSLLCPCHVICLLHSFGVMVTTTLQGKPSNVRGSNVWLSTASSLENHCAC